MLKIDATSNLEDGSKLAASCDYDMPETLEGLAAKFGTDKVYGYAKRAIVVSIQNAMRAELDSSKDVEKAADVGSAWMPPEPRGADPVTKAVKQLKGLGLDDATLASVEAAIKAQLAGK